MAIFETRSDKPGHSHVVTLFELPDNHVMGYSVYLPISTLTGFKPL